MSFHVHTYTDEHSYTSVEKVLASEAIQAAEDAAKYGAKVRISEGFGGDHLTIAEFKEKYPDA